MSDSSDLMDCSLPGSSIHGIFQARVLEWGATDFSDSFVLHALYTILLLPLKLLKASLVAQTVKCLPAVQDTQVRSLGWEDPLEKEMATHSSLLIWRIPRTGEPSGLLSMGSHRVGHD